MESLEVRKPPIKKINDDKGLWGYWKKDKKKVTDIPERSLILALALCYYFRIVKKENRKEYIDIIGQQLKKLVYLKMNSIVEETIKEYIS